jgi:hypothetical protein
MKRALILSGCMAMAMAGGASAKDYSFDFKTIKAQDVMSFPGGYGTYGSLRAKKPAELNLEPAAVSQHPLYGYLGEGSEAKRFLFRVDESGGNGKGYDRLIIDLNRNSDLKDDPVFKSTSATKLRKPAQGGPEEAFFGPIEAPADQRIGNWRPSYYAQVYVYNRQLLKDEKALRESDFFLGNLRFKAGWYLEATVNVDGTKRKVGLVDGDANMHLGDPWKARFYGTKGEEKNWYFSPGDSFLVDVNGSGRFENDPFGIETSAFGSILYFGTQPYQVTLAENRKSVSLEPWGAPLGEVEFSPQGSLVRNASFGWESQPANASGSTGEWQLVEAGVAAGKARVPAGKLRLYGCLLEANVGKADQIRLSAYNRSIANTLTVEAGRATVVKCGPPLEIKVTAAKDQYAVVMQRDDRGNKLNAVRVNASVVGAGGEIYSAWGKGKDFKNDPPKPTFAITGKDGKKIASGNLEFG